VREFEIKEAEVSRMAPNVLPVSREFLEARRSEILAALGVTRDELANRALNFSLSGEEWEALTELEEIEYLLGE
jgi:hypothetical protein